MNSLNCDIPVQVVDNVGVFVFPHYKDFIDNQFLFGLLLQIHLLDCNLQGRKSKIESIITRFPKSFASSVDWFSLTFT